MRLKLLTLWLPPGIGLGGLGTFSLGSSALLGRLAKTEKLYLWAIVENDPGMAVNTALSFSIVGLCLMASGLWMHRHTNLPITREIHPIDTLGVGLLISCIIMMIIGILFKQATMFTASSYIFLSIIGVLYRKKWRRRRD
jgi:hypothetical protein